MTKVKCFIKVYAFFKRLGLICGLKHNDNQLDSSRPLQLHLTVSSSATKQPSCVLESFAKIN